MDAIGKVPVANEWEGAVGIDLPDLKVSFVAYGWEHNGSKGGGTFAPLSELTKYPHEWRPRTKMNNWQKMNPGTRKAVFVSPETGIGSIIIECFNMYAKLYRDAGQPCGVNACLCHWDRTDADAKQLVRDDLEVGFEVVFLGGDTAQTRIDLFGKEATPVPAKVYLETCTKCKAKVEETFECELCSRNLCVDEIAAGEFGNSISVCSDCNRGTCSSCKKQVTLDINVSSQCERCGETFCVEHLDEDLVCVTCKPKP